MKLRLAAVAALCLATFSSCGLLTPVAAQTVTVTGCSLVSANNVAKSTDKVKLAADIACLDRAGPIADAQIAAARKVRQDRLDALSRVKTPPIKEPAPTPTPTPNPTPTPTPTGGTTPATSNGELDKVASGINIADFLQPAWGTGDLPAKDFDVGAFRFLCAPSHNAYNDPIVYPGQPGKSHLHTFFGNTLADANSTYASLRTSGDSTCNNKLNRSAYWIAAMMNGAGKVVMPDYLAVYYKRLPSTDPRCTTTATACVALPRGLRYIFGYDMLNPASTPITEASKYQRWWNCDASPLGADALAKNPGGHYGTIAEAMTANGGCKPGMRLGAVIVAPNCWDGKNLDSVDHRSHMAYENYDQGDGIARCPKTHPLIIPQFQLGAWYTVDATAKSWYLSCDRMPGMAAADPGTCEHADWFGAWEDGIIDLWTANCIDKLLSCSGGDLGNGQQLKTLYGYSYGNTTVLVDPPAMPGM